MKLNDLNSEILVVKKRNCDLSENNNALEKQLLES